MGDDIYCDYCSKLAESATGQDIYPHRPELSHLHFYVCWDCSAWVGCHGNSQEPKGRLANYTLRQAKIQAHAAFDPLWRDNGEMSRGRAYEWLLEQLQVKYPEMEALTCHIGHLNEHQCALVTQVCDRREHSKHSKYVNTLWEN